MKGTVLYRYREYNTGRLGWYQADMKDAEQCFNAIKKDNLLWFEIDDGRDFIWHWNAQHGWFHYNKNSRRIKQQQGLREVFG